VTGQFDQKKCVRDGNKRGDAKRDWQMPNQSRVERTRHLPKRSDENRYAQEPGHRTNGSRNPGKVNQTTPRLFERQNIDRYVMAKALKDRS
jgi:hypothetical protein